jgi:uncharacterized OB-fold protein
MLDRHGSGGGAAIENIEPIADLAPNGSEFTARPDGARLRGCRCLDCGKKFFPDRAICFGCAGRHMEESLLGPTGTLYSYATVHVAPKVPTPYTIGYIDLEQGVRVLAFGNGEAERLRPDLPVTLVSGNDGSWWFEPVDQGQS